MERPDRPNLDDRLKLTDEQKKQDDISAECLMQTAINEINKENNYLNLLKSGRLKSKDRIMVLNKIALLEAGVLDENITVTDICTCCNSELLFSHRASNGKRGNLAAFLELK